MCVCASWVHLIKHNDAEDRTCVFFCLIMSYQETLADVLNKPYCFLTACVCIQKNKPMVCWLHIFKSKAQIQKANNEQNFYSPFKAIVQMCNHTITYKIQKSVLLNPVYWDYFPDKSITFSLQHSHMLLVHRRKLCSRGKKNLVR